MRLELVHLLVCCSNKLLIKSCSGFVWALVRSLSLSPHGPLSQQEGQHCTPWAGCWPSTSPCAVGTLQFLSHVGQCAPLGPVQLHMCIDPAANQLRIKMGCAAQCKGVERRNKGDRCLFLALSSLSPETSHQALNSCLRSNINSHHLGPFPYTLGI